MQKFSGQSLLEYDYRGLYKIISGGQCGADQGGIAAGAEHCVATGGWAPKGWKTAEGPSPMLALFGLQEHSSDGYVPRTKQNVKDSDGTLIVASNLDSAGSSLTISTCIKLKKPHIILHPYYSEDDREKLLTWAIDNRIGVLNVAGNRDYNHAPNPTKHFTAANDLVCWLIYRLDAIGLLKREDINTESNQVQ
jgi:hypothetical protein